MHLFKPSRILTPALLIFFLTAAPLASAADCGPPHLRRRRVAR